MKKFSYVIFMISCFLGLMISAKADSVSLSAGTNSLIVGNSTTITASVSTTDPIFFIEGTLVCSGAGVSGGADMSFDNTSNDVYSKSFSYTVKPTTTGSITCTTTGVRVLTATTTNWSNLTDKTITISVSEPAYIPPKSYSSNNNLKSLEIEGYNIDFNKDNLEYNLDVSNNVEKVNIKASVEDSTAKIKGTGEIEVSEGINKIEVVVTAENGNEKTYVINVTVLELDPIEVTIDKEKYTIVRKEGLIDEVTGYEKTTIKIKDEEVLAYYNEKTKTYLVILKDSKGNINYYTYDKGKYSLYRELKVGDITLSLISDSTVIPATYEKTTITYNNQKIEVYRQKQNSNTTYAYDNKSPFYLVYGINVLTGEESLYTYDSEENTLQRYNSDEVDYYKEKSEQYFMYFLISLGGIGVLFIALALTLTSRKKKKKNKKQFNGL